MARLGCLLTAQMALEGLGAPGYTGVIGAIKSLHKRSRAHPEENTPVILAIP
jgi:hypothetical protein